MTVASSGGLTGFMIGGSLMAGAEALNANGSFSMNSQKWTGVGVGLLAAVGAQFGLSGSANFAGSAIGSGFQWDEKGHQKGGWSLEGARGDAFLTQVAVSGVAQGLTKGAGFSGPGASVLQGTLNSAMTTGVEYAKAQRGQQNNFAGIMNQGFGSALGSTLATYANMGIGLMKAEEAKKQAAEDRKQAIKLNSFLTGKSEADIEAEIARQANEESQRQMAGGIVLGFARRFTEGFVESTGLQELGQAISNAWANEGFVTNDTLERRRAEEQREKVKKWMSETTKAGTAEDVINRIRAAAPEAKKLGGIVTSESMRKGSELRDKIVAAVQAETKNGKPLSNEALMKVCQQFGVSLPDLFNPQVVAQAYVFATKNYHNDYQAQLEKEKPVEKTTSGDLPQSFFDSLPFKSNNEEVRNGIFAIKVQRHQERMAARERNPEVYNADGSLNVGPAFQRWYEDEYMTFSRNVHDGLDYAGMLPVIGMVADGANVVYHAGEAGLGVGTGTFKDAGLSALAFIPVLGDVFAAIKNSAKLSKVVKAERFMAPITGFASSMWTKAADWAIAARNFAAEKWVKPALQKNSERIQKAYATLVKKMHDPATNWSTRDNGTFYRLLDAKTLVVYENHLKDLGRVFTGSNIVSPEFWKHVLPHKHVYRLTEVPEMLHSNWRKTFQKLDAEKVTLWPWGLIK